MAGTTSLIHLRENLEARNIKLTAEEMLEMNSTLDSSKVAGDRNYVMAMTFHGNA
jgi:aryl-alcohol dehydrogenase-like predicted oxidoreductase